jgi:hypothetical protein
MESYSRRAGVLLEEKECGWGEAGRGGGHVQGTVGFNSGGWWLKAWPDLKQPRGS